MLKIRILYCTVLFLFFCICGVWGPFGYSDYVFNNYMENQIVALESVEAFSMDDDNDLYQNILSKSDEVVNESVVHYFYLFVFISSAIVFFVSFFLKVAKPFDVIYFFWPMVFPISLFPHGYLVLLPIFFWGLGFRLKGE